MKNPPAGPDNDRVVTSGRSEEDRAFIGLRPKRLENYIGQEKIKGNLRLFIDAAKGKDRLPPTAGRADVAGALVLRDGAIVETAVLGLRVLP